MTTTISSLPPPVQQSFDMKLLSRPQPNLIHKTFAMPKVLESNMGQILRMRRYTNLATAPVPLGDSMLNPPPQQLTAIDIDAKISWYGTYIIVTKQVTLQNQDPVLNESVSLLAQSLRETEDQLVREVLESTASFVNCVGGTNGDNPTELTRSDIDSVVATLQGNDADFIIDLIEGENKFGTGPVRDSYFGMASTALIGQFEQVQGFINKAQYPSQMNVLSAEWCSIGNVRFLVSSRGEVLQNQSMNGANVYPIFITGQEAYTVIDLDGATAQFIYRPPGSGDDPLLLRQTAGYRFAQVPRITNDAWIIALRCTLQV